MPGAVIEPLKLDVLEAFAGNSDKSLLHLSLSSARVTKSPEEIDVMWYCALVASNAHVQTMRGAKAGMMEYELEAMFLYEIYRNGGCRRAAYTSICACGPNAGQTLPRDDTIYPKIFPRDDTIYPKLTPDIFIAVLHYGHAGAPNDRQLRPTDMALLDMGAGIFLK